MAKRLAAMFLLLALGSGVASGAPLRSGGSECDTGHSMDMMECCKRARMHGDTPEIQAARLCCAVNCQSGGASGPASATRVAPPQAAPSHPAAVAPKSAPIVVPRERRRAISPHPDESPPVYLLNLTFLI